MDGTDKRNHHARFWKKFLRLTRGRVTVLRALEVMALEEQEGEFKTMTTSLKDDIAAGSALSDAMKKFPDAFSPSVLELVRTAEKTGAWDEILMEIADGLQEGTFD